MENGGVLSVSLEDIVIEGNGLVRDKNISPGPYVKLIVADTGTGISKDIIESIFEPYFTTKPVGQGTGMGLAIVHGIVKKYKGEISVSSEIGKGSKFTVLFPITEKEGEIPAYKSESLPIGTEHILFVDDEIAIAAMGEQMLIRLGYKVTTRTNSVEALELFDSRKNDFDLVITDTTMPNMTGYQLAVELVRVRPDIPVILCTGYSNKISDVAASGTCIKAFAYKPSNYSA